MSPSTEFIPSAESEAISNISWQPQADFQGIYSHINTEQPCSISTIQENQTDTVETILDDPTYAIVDNNRNDNSKEQHENDSHSGLPVPFNSQELNVTIDQASRTVENESKLREKALEATYAVVNKKRKNDEEDASPLPSHTVDKLYTAVNKNLKVNATGDEGKAPPIPPHTIKELYTTVKKDTTIKAENEEVAPPLPPHMVEELYTAIVKKPKGNAEKDEEEAPPIPPQMID